MPIKSFKKGLESGKKNIFVPDSCLGQNFAKSLNLKSAVVGDGSDLKEADIICYNGFVQFINNFLLKILSFIEKNSLIF